MSKKKQTNVQPATEETPTEPQVPTEEQPAQLSTASPLPREEIEKAFNNPMLRGFKKYLDPLLTYFESVELRLQTYDKAFGLIGEKFDELKPLVQLSQQVAQRQQQAQAAPTQTASPSNPLGGMDIGALLQLIAPVLGGGGGGDSELAELGKQALKSQIGMSTAITNAVVAKIAGKATTEVAEAVIGA